MWDWLVNILFEILKLIQGFAVDWGLSIIILVLIIRIILTPLLLKSTKSTARMQVLQPRLMELQQKYQDDPQRMNEEMQKFYSENKFNPFGGCLPLRLVHRMHIDADLVGKLTYAGKHIPFPVSVGRDPENDLIPQLYMARNQTGQQATTMRTTALVMAVMMLFIGWALPAGVLLYYDVSTLWQVIQQIFVTQKVMEKAKAEEEARLANAPIEVDVVRRERKERPHKKR